MPRSAFTGSRRQALKAAGFLPASLLLPKAASPTEYPSALAALAAIDAAVQDVVRRLRTLATQAGPGRDFARSLLSDQEQHRLERAGLEKAIGLSGGRSETAEAAAGDPPDLEGLKDAQQKLTYALAEALPVLGGPAAVRTLARQMVDASRHLTLIGLWIEAEERRAAS